MINGLFNQIALLFARVARAVLAPPLFFGSTGLTLMFSSLMVSTATSSSAHTGGDYERVNGAEEDFNRRITVDWLAGTACDPAGDGQLPVMGYRPAAQFYERRRHCRKFCHAANLAAHRRIQEDPLMEFLPNSPTQVVLRASRLRSLAIFCIHGRHVVPAAPRFQAGGFLTTMMA